MGKQGLGPEHPRAAGLRNNGAEVYRKGGRDEQDEPLYQRALHMWEQVLGPEDRDLAMALHGLAELYRAQGKYEQAEPLYIRALHLWEQAVPGHTQITKLLTGPAELYIAQDQDQ